MTRRVVVTGAGVVTALGYELADFWERICAGKSGVGPLKRFETTDFKVTFGGEIRDFSPKSTSISKTRNFADLTASSSLRWSPRTRRSNPPDSI